MSIAVKKRLVSADKYALKCPNPMTPEYITIHNTANDASAANEISYMTGNSESTSYHFAVDDKEVIQGVPLDRNAWHSGDGTNGTGNRKSIAVEICYSKSGGTRYRAAEELAITFIAQLLKERGWGIDRIRKHQDWNGKYCPHRILSEGRWDEVKAAIEKKVNGGADIKTVSSVHKDSVYYVKKGDTLSGIAQSTGVSLKTLQSINHIQNPDLIKIGQAIKLGSAASSAVQTGHWKLPTGILKVTSPLTKGSAVLQVQEALSSLYFYPDKGAKNHGADGVYGAKTANAVKRFQSVTGLSADGIYGSKTKAKLEAKLS